MVTIFDPKGAKVNTTLPGDANENSQKATPSDNQVSAPSSIDTAVLPPKREEESKDKVIVPPTMPPKSNRPVEHKESLFPDDDVPPVITEIDNLTGLGAPAPMPHSSVEWHGGQ